MQATSLGGVVTRGADGNTRSDAPPPVRVAHVMWRLSERGGVQRVVRMLANGLDPARVSLHVVQARQRLPEDRLEQVPVPVHTLNFPMEKQRPTNKDRLVLSSAAARLLKQVDPDVVHLHSGTAWLGLARRASSRSTFLLQVHDAPGSGRHRSATDLAEGLWVSRLGSHLVCHSEDVYNEIVARWNPREPGKITKFPLGVDTTFFSPAMSGRQHEHWRAAHGIGPDSVVMLFVGRLVPSKRIDQAVDLVASLQSRGRSVEAAIIGSGPEQERIRTRAVAAGVQSRIHFVQAPSDEELREAYRSADVFCSTSEYEGFGLTLAESMSSGTPVVAYANGGVKQVVVDGVTGFLINDGNIRQMAEAIERLCEDKDTLQQMGASGRAHALLNFSEAGTCGHFAELYERIRASD